MYDKLAVTAAKLVMAMNKSADSNLDEKLADIVKTHSALAVGAAIVPVPGADVAAAAANVWTMYGRINGELDIPFKENVIKSVAAGVATNIGGAAAGLVIAGTALKFLPGVGTVGGAAIMGATIYGITMVSGIVYMRALTALANKKNMADVTEADLKAATEEAMSDKSEIKDMIKESRKSYKPS
ncbi:MAG: hypothetical protein AAFQ22_13010 [Pseudomonadota bacterium]